MLSILLLLNSYIIFNSTVELTHCGGMDHGLADLHDFCYIKGMSPEPLARMLEIYASTQYDRKQKLWASTLKWHCNNILEETLRLKGWLKVSERDFLHSDDDRSICSPLASASYIDAFWRVRCKRHEQDLVQQMSLLPMTIAKNDMSFKVGLFLLGN